MIRVKDYSMYQLVSMRDQLVDRISENYSNELDRNNESGPSKEVIEIMGEYKEISNEIERRRSAVRKFSSIISSGRSVKDYYDNVDSLTTAIESNDWYNVHHDYRMSY